MVSAWSLMQLRCWGFCPVCFLVFFSNTFRLTSYDALKLTDLPTEADESAQSWSARCSSVSRQLLVPSLPWLNIQKSKPSWMFVADDVFFFFPQQELKSLVEWRSKLERSLEFMSKGFYLVALLQLMVSRAFFFFSIKLPCSPFIKKLK